MNQPNLFQRYCIDACAILDFWDSQSRTRPYHVKVKTFRGIWNHISKGVEDGSIVVPKIVANEITTEVDELKNWLKNHKKVFISYSDCLIELSKIIKAYPIYSTNRGSLADAVVVAIAMTNNLTVITSEYFSIQPNKIKPKIPNVCDDFSVRWMNLPEFFEAEGL